MKKIFLIVLFTSQVFAQNLLLMGDDASYTLTDTPNLELWMQYGDVGAEQSIITKTGAVINSITDISGNGRTITPVTVTNQPADGTTHITMETGYFTCDALASVFTGDDKPATIIALVKFQDLSTIRTVWSFGKNGSDLNYFISQATAVPIYNMIRRDGTSTATFSSVGVPSTAAFQLVVYTFDGDSAKIYINGVKQGNTTVLEVNTFDLDRFTIGALGRTSYANPINGYLKSFAVYSRALTDAELVEVHAYYGY